MTDNSVQSVDRAMMLVTELLSGPQPLKSLSIHLGIGAPGTLKLLRTLLAHGLVEKLPNGMYMPGIRCCELARGYLRQHPLIDIARPIMKELSLKLNGRTVLAVLRNLDQINLLLLDAQTPAPEDELPFRVGAAWPQATGQVLLAFSPEGVLEQHLQQYPFHPLGPEIPHVDILLQKLAEIRHTGVALVNPADQQTTYIAAPIRAVTGEVVAAIGGYAQRHAPIEPQLAWLSSAAHAVSVRLGVPAL